MTTKLTLFGGIAIVAASGWAGLSGCSQQGMSCTTARGSFTVKLALKSGTGECSEEIGGLFGVNSYNYPGASGRPDFDRASMAIQSEVLGLAVSEAEERLGETPDPDNKEYAFGDFDSAEPDGKDVCRVPTLSEAQKDIPLLPLIPEVPAVPDDPATPDVDESEEAVPEVPEKPAESFSYAWSSMRFVVSEAFPGTLFVADLTYTHNGCVAEYEAWGMHGVSALTGVPTACLAEDGSPDDSLCDANLNEDAAYLNTDLNIGCDADLGVCFIRDRPPVD